MTAGDQDLLPYLRAELADVPVGTITYALDRLGLTGCFIPVSPVTSTSTAFIGQARTLRTGPRRSDVLNLRSSAPKHLDPHRIAFDEAEAGDVLVISARGVGDAAVMGDLLAQRLRTIGAAGVVTDGAVRDLLAIDQVGIPVFASGVHSSLFSTRHYALDVNVPVGCGDVLVFPGDILVGDPEGVAVLPRVMARDIAAAAVQQESLDTFIERKLKDGHLLKDAYPPNATLQAEYDGR